MLYISKHIQAIIFAFYGHIFMDIEIQKKVWKDMNQTSYNSYF